MTEPLTTSPPSVGMSPEPAEVAYGIAFGRLDGESIEQHIASMKKLMGWDAVASPVTWREIESAPKVHPLNGGDDLLLAWIAPGIGEWIRVVGCWRDGWFSGSNKAYPTHWMPVPPNPPLSLTSDRTEGS